MRSTARLLGSLVVSYALQRAQRTCEALRRASEALPTGLLVVYRAMGTHNTADIAGGAGESVEPSFCCQGGSWGPAGGCQGGPNEGHRLMSLCVPMERA